MFQAIKTVARANAKHAADHPIAHAVIPLVVSLGVKYAVHSAIAKTAEIHLESMKIPMPKK